VARPPVRFERLPGRPDDGVEAVLAARLPSDVRLVDRAVELLLGECVAGRDASRRTLFRLRVAIGEALTNAIQCGNGGDPRKLVAIRADLFPDRVRVWVSDEGPGFDPTRVPDPSQPGQVESPCGRGLFLIRHLADDVGFNEKGNTIWMTLPRW
jgi:serine/threonine-protein kinase RsbW